MSPDASSVSAVSAGNEADRSPLTTTRQLLADLQAYHARVSVLQEIATAIGRELTLDGVLQVVGRRVKWLLDFDHCSIYLNRAAGSSDFIPLFGSSSGQTIFKTASSSNLIEQVIQTKQPYLTQNDPQPEMGAGYRSYLIIPLESEGDVLGTINFASQAPHHYRQEDLRIGHLLTMHLAAAIRNANRFAEVNRLYAELAQTYDDLRRAEQLRDDLTRMIIHDLRNPLNVLLGSLEILELMLDAPRQAENRTKWLHDALSAGRGMVGLIDDLLEVSKADDQKLQPNLAPVDLVKVLAEKENFYRAQAEQEQKMITMQAVEGLPPVMADVRLMSRVIDNLINNAFKYTEAGGCIALKIEEKERGLQVQVQDNGQGIPPEYHHQIFDKFVQVTDTAGAPLRKGIGLGLAFCRLAVEAHQGKIWVESVPGQGSTFIFTLPL